MKQSFSHYFPTPSYLNMDSFVLDISDESIKYGKLTSTSAGFKFSNFGKDKIPPNIIVSGKINNKEKLIDYLIKLKKIEKLNFIRVSLPEEQIYIFILSLPQLHGEDLRDVILLQIEEHIPLGATEVIFDYDTIEENEKRTIVRVTAISIEVIESYLSVFKEAGLIPLSFESEAQAITRSVFPLDEKEVIMIVDFGYTRTGVSISYNGKVLFTTTIDIGGFNLTEMLAKNFSISFSEAEKMKRSYGLKMTSKVKDIFPVLLNGVSVLRDELNKQYVYWNTHTEKSDFKHKKINRIILCGGNANLSGLAEYLEASMKIKVEYANVWVNIFDMDKFVPEISFEDSLSYSTVIGLGLNSYLNKSQSILNILPPKHKKNLRRKYFFRFISVFLGFFAGLELFLIFLLLPSYFFSVSKQKIVDNRLESFNLNNPKIEKLDIDSKVKNINNKLTLISNYSLEQGVSNNIFGWILENKPDGVFYSQILYNKRTDGSLTVDVRGVALNRSVLYNLKSLFENNPNYKEVNLPISSFLEKENLNFTISIILK